MIMNEITKHDFNAFLVAAEQGDTKAMYMIGYCYFWGKGTRKNRNQAECV